MNEWEKLIEILEASLKKNGDKPITISHFLNIVKMVQKDIQRRGEIDNVLGGWDE